MLGQYKSIQEIFSNLSENPLLDGVNESTMARLAARAIKLIGTPLGYNDDFCEVKINNFKGNLPRGLVYINQTYYKPNSNTNKTTSMRYATDTFHSAYHVIGSPDFKDRGDITYTVNDDCITVSEEEGIVGISYKGIKVDSDGFPMIPNDVKFEMAIEAFIKKEAYEALWILGKLPDKVYSQAQQDYTWYVGAAQSRGQLLSLDQAESFTAAFTRLLLKPLQHKSYFSSSGAREYLHKGSI